MDGVINLDKPAGLSSARVVAKVKRLLARGSRVGHAGTLDPFATGVLLVLIGKASKASQRLMDQPKTYETTIKLGATTPTDDPESPEQSHDLTLSPPSRRQIEALLPQFRGTILQRPPAFSAMKVGGRRAYDLARRGRAPTLEPRLVSIYLIELLDYAWPFLRLRIDCGRGTYIRSLARDLGEALGVGGHLTQLRRTRIGDFGIDRAVTLEQISSDGVGPHLLDVSRLPGAGPRPASGAAK